MGFLCVLPVWKVEREHRVTFCEDVTKAVSLLQISVSRLPQECLATLQQSYCPASFVPAAHVLALSRCLALQLLHCVAGPESVQRMVWKGRW